MSHYRVTSLTPGESATLEGNRYFAIYSALANDTGLIEVRIATPNTAKRIHMTFNIECALAATVALWTATTKTHVTGNAITPMNHDMNSPNVSVATVCHTPAGTQSGDPQLQEYVGAAASGGRVAAGGEATNNSYFILKQNTAYLVRATSRADGNALSIILDWHETDD
jgi:hypothetical protein